MKKASTCRLSSSTSRPSGESIKVGYVRRAHGIKGAVVVRVLDQEGDLFVAGSALATDNPRYPELTLVSAKPHKDGLLVALEGITDRNEAETLRGVSFVIDPGDRRELDDDEFWPEQLVGLKVVDEVGGHVGSVTDLVSGTAQARLVVTTDEGITEVPFVAAIVVSIDIEAGVVVVDAPEGLF